MRNAVTMMLALAVAALPGCGGEDGAEPEVLTGTLQAGGVQGMQFSTPTQSGVTDASGSFKYQAGESITFSIGSVPFGTVPGAAEISLFRLAGLTPPSTELHLRRELNRAMTTTTALSRAINMARFLLALDVDGNPANGIDVRGRESTLAPNVDFDAHLQVFGELLASSAPNLNNNITPARSTLHLYRWAGVKVRANYAVRQLRDSNGDGRYDSALRGVYDANGEIQASHFDSGADGDEEGATEYFADALGRRTRVLTTNDSSGDGVADYTYTFTQAFDARGNLTLQTSLEQGGLLPVYHYEQRHGFTYDDRGRLLTATYELRDPFDAALVTRTVITYTRDVRGNATRVVTDGFPSNGQSAYRIVQENSFDSAGRMTHATVTRDDDSNGQVDFRQTTTFNMDMRGRPETSLEESDTNADGAADRRQRIRYSYDRAGNQERVQVEDELVIGVVSSRTDTQSTFDRDHRPLTRVTTVDSDADGDIDETTEYRHSYDSNGMLTEMENVNRNLTANTIGYRSHYEISYSTEGAPLSELYTLDFNGDGEQDFRDASRIEYEISEDALPRILHNHLSYPGVPVAADAAF